MIFIELGGFHAYLTWAKENEADFYELFFKTAPSSKPGEYAGAGGMPRNGKRTGPAHVVKIKDFTE